MQKLLAFFLAMLLSVSIIAGCGSNSPKTNDKQTTQTTNVNTTKSNNGQNTAANVKANSGKIKNTAAKKSHVLFRIRTMSVLRIELRLTLRSTVPFFNFFAES